MDIVWAPLGNTFGLPPYYINIMYEFYMHDQNYTENKIDNDMLAEHKVAQCENIHR